ncbi:MAG: hypothetical protein RKE49_13340 [Oceanicaulis sp.]
MLKSLFAAAVLSMQPAATEDADPVARMEALLSAQTRDAAAFTAAAGDLRAAAEAGDADAMNLHGLLVRYEMVEGGDPSAWYRRAMEVGDAEAAALARLRLAEELYLADAPQEARALLETETALPEGFEAGRLALLGRDLLFGLSGQADPDHGQALINSAMARGFEGAALIEAAGHYWSEPGENGEMRNRDRALRLLSEATRFGSASAAWSYAMVVLNEGGDPAEAWRYVAWSAEQGYLDALVSRAVMLATGEGVEQDAGEARQWYARAAARGSAHAARGLGAMLITGEGGPVDAARGYALVDLAAAGGDAYARHVLAEGLDGAAPRPGEAAVTTAREAFLAQAGLTAQDFQ